jgi:Domain of unknown function (DUF4190)
MVGESLRVLSSDMSGYPGGYYPPPQPYGAYPPVPVAPPKKDGLGISALIVAILGLLFSWSVVGGVVLGVVAVILGFVGRGRVKAGEASNGGVALAGIILGALAVVVSLVFIAIWYGAFSDIGGSDYLDCVSKAGQDPRAVESCANQFQDHLESQFSVSMTPHD